MSTARTFDRWLVTGSVLILVTLLGFGIWTAKKSSQANATQALEVLWASSRALNEFDRLRFAAQTSFLSDQSDAEDGLKNAVALAQTWKATFRHDELRFIGDPTVEKYSARVLETFGRIEAIMVDQTCDSECRPKKVLSLSKRGKREAAKLQGRGLVLDRQTRHSLTSLNTKTLQLIFAACFSFMALMALIAYSARRTNRQLREQQMKLTESQHRLEDIGRYRAQFLAGMSHEFRTPLNAIKGFSQFILMMKGNMPSTQLMDYVQDIEKSASDLVSITNSVLDLSKIDAGSVDLHEENVDLAEMVREVKRQFSVEHDAKRLRIDASGSLEAYCDLTAIKRCVQNALANALKFSPPDSPVDIKLEASKRGIVFKISDRGCGIPADELDAVWQVYSRSSYTRVSDKQGSGLGLPIIKGIIEAHGGEVALESVIDVGTVLTMVLPPERLRVAPSLERQDAA